MSDGASAGSGGVRMETRDVQSPLRRRPLVWLAWLVALVATTLVLLTLRGHLDKAHIALALLLLVLVGSAAGGRALGLTLVGLSFVSFNFFFLPPYYTLAVADPWDWLVLAAFLATSIVATQLLDRAQERAEVARRRADEVGRLAILGSETLNAGRAEDALAGITEVIRSAIGVSRCDVLVPRGTPAHFEPLAVAVLPSIAEPERQAPNDRQPSGASGSAPTRSSGDGSLAEWVASHNAPAAVHGDGTTSVGSASSGRDLATWHTPGHDVRELYLPLSVRDRTVGVLRLEHTRAIELHPEQRQFLSALSYYAALGVERWHLVAEAERAEAYRQADALKSALIATVSHDLRTPLTTIKALAHALAEQGQPEARSIEDEADRLNRFIADLLDLSRLTSGGLQLRLEVNSVADVVGAAVQRVRAVAAASTIIVERDETGEELFGRFDFVQVVRALANLLENALKYSPGPPVELRVARAGDRLDLAVADRGPGVPPLERVRIFQPFYRAPGTPPDVGGAGLGLAIARGIASEHGGSLEFEERAGGGSIFRLTLPVLAIAPDPDSVSRA